MKLNIFTKSMIGMGLVCSSLPALAMEAWNNQQGGNKYQELFSMAKFMKMPGGFLLQIARESESKMMQLTRGV